MSIKSKILLINLDKSKERLALCDKRMIAAQLSYERISAVYGADLDTTQIDQHYSKHLGWRSYYKELNVGEIGCYLSHRKAWQKIVDEQLDFAIILEDDFYMSGDLTRVMNLIGEIQHEWHYIKLAKHSRKRKAIHQIPLAEYSLVTYDKVPARTCAQVVSYAGAKLLLANSSPFGRPIDIDLQHWWEKKIKLFGIEPCPVTPDESMGSEIDKFALRNQAKKQVLKDVFDKLRFLIANWLANKSRLKALNKL
jgi:glycosyl transferase, family 25